MTGRRGNNNNYNKNNNPNRFGGSAKKSANQNRNRMSGGKSNNYSNSSNGLMNPVSPWLSQSNNSGSSFNSLGRNLVNDRQAQLALASDLLNNLLSPNSQLTKLTQPPSLLSLGNISNAVSSFGASPSYNRDRFNSGRRNQGKVQKKDDHKKFDFKNKRFGGGHKNSGFKKNDHSNKKPVDEKIVEKKEIDIKPEVKVDKPDSDAPVSEDRKEEVVVKNDKNEEPPVKEETNKPEEVKINYSEIPSALLFCHICRKHMWDDTSFEKHLEGRPHKIMVEELDRCYKLKVDLLRHEMRVMEQQRENDIHRAQRKGKSNVKSQQRGFCTMCDLSFLGLLPAHRKNEKHQRLKKFLHPKCNACSKEFYTRLEWDDHKLTPVHLKKLAEIRKNTRPDLEDTEFDIADFIDDVNDEIEAEGIDVKVSGKRETLEELQQSEVKVKDESVENGNEEKDDQEKEGKEEDEDAKKLPKYNQGIPVGENFVVNKTGHLCRACNRFMLSSEDIKIHCQTLVHFNNIIKILKAQNKIVRKRKLNELKAEEEKNAKANESQTVDGESQPKKVKTDDDNSNVNGTVENEITQESKNISPGEQKYDPEDPESEPEKDVEVKVKEKEAMDVEPESVLPVKDVEVVKESEEKKLTPVVCIETLEKKPVAKSVPRGPRARRGRRF